MPARGVRAAHRLFIDDMDATLRQIGIGDYVVGKHVGRMMGALGGRLGAPCAKRARRGRFRRRGPAQRLPRRAAVRRRAGLGRRAAERSPSARRAAARAPARRRGAVAMTAPEFSRPVRVDTLGEEPRTLGDRSREPEERAALANASADRDRPARRRPRLTRAARRSRRAAASRRRGCRAALPAASRSPATSRSLSTCCSGRRRPTRGRTRRSSSSESELDVIFYEGGAIDLGEAVAETHVAQSRSLSARAGRRGGAEGGRGEERGGSGSVRRARRRSGTS